MSRPVMLATLLVLSCNTARAAAATSIVEDNRPHAVTVTAAGPTQSAQRGNCSNSWSRCPERICYCNRCIAREYAFRHDLD